jgi:Tfp pilus assembly PilM family ATPase
VVIPDGAAKVSVVRFEKVPAKAEDLAQLVRWQVRKSVPFPIEQSQVSWTPGVTDAAGTDYVVTVARQDIVQDYEQAVAAAGVQVGLVDLATFNLVNLLLAGDPAATPSGDWLLVHVTPDASTMVIVREGALLLFRHRPVEGEGSLSDLGHQTAMYYEDRLNGRGLSRAVLAARDVGAGVLGDLQALGRAIEQRVGKAVVEIDPRALVRIAAESGSGGDRAAIAAPVGVLLRERVG